MILPQKKTSAVSTRWSSLWGVVSWSFIGTEGLEKREGERRPQRWNLELSGSVLGELTECGALASTGKQTVQQTGWDCHKNGCNGKEERVRACCT